MVSSEVFRVEWFFVILNVAHGDDFTFCGLEEDLVWIRNLLEGWFEIKVRAMVGHDENG